MPKPGRSPSGRAGRASPEPASSLGHTSTIPNAVDLWRAAVRAGEDYPCKYWGIAACEYRGSFGCDCLGIREYREKAQAIEARQGGDGETRLHRNDESAVGNADAPKD